MPAPVRGAALVVGVLILVTPFIVAPAGKESFRLPQGLTAGWLALLSLALVFGPPGGTRGLIVSIWRQSALRALAPLTVVVALGGWLTAHPVHFTAAFADFLIAVTCLVVWTMAIEAAVFWRLLGWTIVPGVIVAVLGLDQSFNWLGLLDWLQVQAPTERLRLTSTLGNPGDLAAFVVLPLLVALSRLARARRKQRFALVLAIVTMGAVLAITGTLAALTAAGLAAAVQLGLAMRRRSLLDRRMALATAALVSAVAILAVATPLGPRVSDKIGQLARGDVNAFLTGRLDGWRAAMDMLRRQPLSGVGHGAFRAAYADTRLALIERGVPVFAEQTNVMMATPHNEPLSVAAEQGAPGILALAWAVWCLYRAARRVSDDAERATAWSGLAALAALATVWFPFHAPAVAWPWLLLLAWVFRKADESGAVGRSPTPVSVSTGVTHPLAPTARWSCLALVLLTLVWQTVRARDRLEASRLLAQVEARTQFAIRAGRAPSTMFAQHLAWLDAAARLDPLEIGIPTARGTQLLLLRRPSEAMSAYRAAAALEPRPEIDMNMGRALLMQGARAEARAAFTRAVRLDPHLRAEVPADVID